ncbi:hypothetical protein HYC85_031462 [Camellia sinensis]|uniref:HSA domain-containing protein n=1 Tax=Camellia sinensis TaxID=4442 RepID=A0A7J7FQV4_CAMSI|nr:hypothetical protein HYC85_031462 [Camellia sinensis]
MHGCSLGSALLVNAEVNSMGGVVDGGVGIGTKASPRRAAIEKAQTELRQEHDVREERRRELEFLEKQGGNPLDFKFGNGASVSVQSTSLTDQPPEQFLTSEAKGSFALTASPHGDSVESSGRLGDHTVSEPNCADNLLLFDGESEFLEGERNSVHHSRSNIAPSEQSSQLDGSQNAKESGESDAFGLPKNQAYKRRNRSRSNRDGARSSSTNMVPSRGGNVCSLPSRHGPKDGKGSLLDTKSQKDLNVSSTCNSKPTSPNGNLAIKALPSDGWVDVALDNVQAVESTTGLTKVGLPEPLSDFNTSKNLQDIQHNQHSQVDTQETSAMISGGPESVSGREQVVSAGIDCLPCVTTEKAENQTSSVPLNGFTDAKRDRKGILIKGQNSSAAFSTKGLDSESSCTQANLSLDGNNDSDPHNNLRNVDTNGNAKEQTLVFVGALDMEGDDKMLNEKNETKADDSYAFINDEHNSVHQNHQSNGFILRVEEELHGNGSGSQHEVKCPTSIDGMDVDGNTASETERKPGNSLTDNLNPQNEFDCTGRLGGSADSSVHDNSNPQKESACGGLQGSMDISGLSETKLSVRVSTGAPEQQTCSETRLKLTNKAREDSILKEARIIEAKRKRIAELSVGTLPLKNHRKSHWDFVLEEMAWLANDFAQERLWKITAAAQVCHRIASTYRLRFEEQNLRWKQKKVAHTLAQAIMDFWRSAEENLFYVVSPGAMETYRNSIESHLAKVEKTGSCIQEEVETSMYDAAADFVSQGGAYEEDEGETSTYYLPGGFEGNTPSKFGQKKRKNLTKSNDARAYDLGTNSPIMQCMENKVGTQQSVLMGKQPANILNVGSIPTKRIRTASRQRFLYPFSGGTSGGVQGPNKTDASSGDTNSFQDDQSTMHGGFQIRNSLEVESVGDLEKQLPFDSTEVSKPKKKKKAKHLGSTYEHRWQFDNNFEQVIGIIQKGEWTVINLSLMVGVVCLANSIMKKPKMTKQSLDNSFDNLTPMSGTIPSPVASQMSNMSNPNKLIKILGGRDRGRKTKSSKMPTGQPGSGGPWSLFEDQALVVLVHDMGPHWELVSDAINSTLQFKGPMEEDMIKSHFGKIITISQKQHYCRIKNDNQDLKPIQPHHSHTIALSQVCPNYLNGGPPLTDGRYGVPRSASLAIDEQQRMQQYNQMLSGRNVQQPGLSVSGALPGTDRGVRMLPGGNSMGVMCGTNRNMPMARPSFQGIGPSSILNSGGMLSSSMAVMPSPVNMHSGVGSGQGNSMLRPRDALNMMRPGQNPEHQRQMMVPELQMQVAQGNSQGVPPFVGLSSAFSNQTSPPAQTYPLHPQQAHVLSNSHHPHLQGPNHAASTQHQAYAMRIAKERQMQQRLQLQQQHQQQFAASNALMPHVQSQSQLPISSSMQSSSQVQPQTTSAPVSLPSTHSSSMTPMSQHQQKLHMPPHGQNRNPQTAGSGLTNQMGKQRQRQPQQQQQQQQSFQQSGRHHPQQRQQSQSQQQAKLIKGIGRGNVLMHQNLTIDPSLLNGISTTPAGQSAEKEEQVVHLMQGQGLYPGSGLNPVQPSKSLMPPHQQKMYSGQAIPSSKQVQQMPYSDNSNQGHAAPATSGQTLPVSHSVVTSSNHQQLQPHQKSVNQTQPIVQRVFQQNRQSNSDPPSKLQAGQAQPDQQPVSNSPQMGTATAMPQFTTDTTTVKPVVSSSGTQWKAPDQMHDSGMPNSAMQLAPNGSPPLTNSAGSEPMPMVSQGLGQGQSSGSLPPLGHNGGARWPEHQSQLQPPSTPLPPPPQQQQQQQQSPRQQMPQQLQSQQQTQHLQAGNGSLYIRPTNSRIE